jgi:protein-glucosylgalactosylhydroxylysine glucosidase
MPERTNSMPQEVAIKPISPPPLDHLAGDSLLAYLGNGFLGLRVGRIPLFDGLAIVSGFWGPHPKDGIPAFAPVPYPLAGDITIDGRRASDAPEAIEFIDQRIDFASGELTSRFTFQAGDVTAAAEVLTFCSRTDPALVLQELTVRCDRDAKVTLAAAIGTLEVPGQCVDAGLIPRGEPETADAWLLWEGMGDAARCGLVLAAIRDGLEHEPVVRADPVTGQVVAASSSRATAGRPVRLRTIVGLVPDLAHPRPHRQAALLVGRGLSRGWDSLREANRLAWTELWRGSPRIDARGDWQRLADASYFYLHASASPASLASTGVFGLGYAPDYHFYRGHVMWDVDTFALPALVLTNPDAARALLRFRSRTTAAARANAAMHGYAGVQYPWEADFDGGFEAVPRWSKTDKDHVTLDVGLAYQLYANVTGDRLFTQLEALPAVAGVAEWLLSRVEATERGLEIRSARGPAEAFEPVDNDAYVNLAAITFLRQAAAMLRSLGDDPPAEWEAAADAIVIPRDPRTGAIVNHDGYRPGEPLGETPEAAAAFFPMGYRDRPEVEAATLRYALRHQVPRYVGTPMFSGLVAVHAVWLGRRKLAAELFDRGYANFFDDPFWAPDEYEASDERFPPASPMLANLGAFLDSLLYGLPGIAPNAADPRTWTTRRVILPSGWEAIEVERLWVRGRPARLVARHGADHASLKLGELDWLDTGQAERTAHRLRIVEVGNESASADKAPAATRATQRRPGSVENVPRAATIPH